MHGNFLVESSFSLDVQWHAVIAGPAVVLVQETSMLFAPGGHGSGFPRILPFVVNWMEHCVVVGEGVKSILISVALGLQNGPLAGRLFIV